MDQLANIPISEQLLIKEVRKINKNPNFLQNDRCSKQSAFQF